MNSTLQPPRLSAAGTLLQPGVPFSTRMHCGAKTGRSPVVLGNRAFIRAWTALRATRAVPTIHRDK